MEIDAVLSMATPPRRTVSVCLRGDLASKAETLRTAWQDAADRDRDHIASSTAPALWDELAEVEKEAQAATAAFTFEAVSSTLWRKLVAEHPPPPDETGWLWDPETFPIAALAASCIEPAMSESQAIELAEKLSNAQWQKLFLAAMNVNVGDDLVPLFASATGEAPPIEESLTTPAPEESLTASS